METIMAEITGHYIWVGPYRIYYEYAGEGKPVICFPSAGAPATEYRHILEYFGDRGYRIYAVEPPGHSHSFPDMRDLSLPSTEDEFIEFIWNFAVSLNLTEKRPVFVGCAMTGSMMLRLAIDHGREISGVIAGEGNSRFQMDLMLSMLNHPSVNSGDFMEVATPMLCSRKIPRETLNECIWHNGRAAVPEAFHSELAIYDGFDVSDRLHEIECPVLHVYGTEDPSISEFSVQNIQRNIRKLMTIPVERMGHIAPVDNPDGFISAMEHFFQKYYPAPQNN